jgi:ubiquitin thioesterase protein OTUB1
VERILQSPDPDFAVASSLSSLAATRDSLDKAGIDKIVYEDIYDEFVGLIGTIVQPNSAGKKLDSAGLLLAFQSPESVSHLTSLYLESHIYSKCQTPSWCI